MIKTSKTTHHGPHGYATMTYYADGLWWHLVDCRGRLRGITSDEADAVLFVAEGWLA